MLANLCSLYLPYLIDHLQSIYSNVDNNQCLSNNPSGENNTAPPLVCYLSQEACILSF